MLKEYDLESELVPVYILNEEKIKIIKKHHKNRYQDLLEGEQISLQEINIFHSWLSHEKFYYSSDYGDGGFLCELLTLIEKINLSRRYKNRLMP